MCNNANYHGHNYELEVKVVGAVDEVSGYVIDMKVLKTFIDEEVSEAFDHKNLNLDVTYFKSMNPTTENVAKVIYEILRSQINNELELKIKLYETPRNYVEYPY